MPSLTVKWRKGKAYAYGTIAGERIRKSLATSDKREAEIRCAEYEAQKWKDHRDGPQTVFTWADAALSYLENGGEARFLKPLTRYFKETNLKNITATRIQKAALELHPQAKPSTRNRQVIVPARAVINHAHAQGWCPPIKVKRFKEEKAKKIAIDWNWIDQFIEHAPDRCGALCMFMFTTGARISEATALLWEDTSLNDRTALLRSTKNGEDHTVRLTRELVVMLANLSKDEGSITKVFGYPGKSSVYKHWKKACLEAGVEYVPPHQAGRHSFATELIIRNGVSIPEAAKLGNWKSHRILSETYTHPENESDIIDSAFSRKNDAKNGTQINKSLKTIKK